MAVQHPDEGDSGQLPHSQLCDGGVDVSTTMMMIGRRIWSTCGNDVQDVHHHHGNQHVQLQGVRSPKVNLFR